MGEKLCTHCKKFVDKICDGDTVNHRICDDFICKDNYSEDDDDEKQVYSELASNIYDCLTVLAERNHKVWIDCYNYITGEDINVDDVDWEN